MQRRYRIGVSLGGLVVASAMAFAVHSWPSAGIAEGVRIAGEFLPEDHARATWFEEHEATVQARSVTLRHEDRGVALSLGELGVAIDRTESEARAAAVAHVGSPWRRLREAREARRGRIDVGFAWSVDRSVAVTHLESIARTIDRSAEPARLDLTKRERVPAVSGRRVDVDATLARLEEQLSSLASGSVTSLELVVVETLPDDGGLAGLDGSDLTRQLAAFETRYSVTKKSRAHNVELAARRIDGLIVAPGRR